MTFSVSKRHLFVKSPAQRVQHSAFHCRSDARGVDHETAVVCAHQPLDPHAAGAAIHLDIRDLSHDRLVAVRVGDTATGEDLACSS